MNKKTIELTGFYLEKTTAMVAKLRSALVNRRNPTCSQVCQEAEAVAMRAHADRQESERKKREEEEEEEVRRKQAEQQEAERKRQEELPSEEPLTLKPIWQKRREQPLTLKPKWQKRREREQWLISKAKEPSTWKSKKYPWLHAHNPGPVSAKIQETEAGAMRAHEELEVQGKQAERQEAERKKREEEAVKRQRSFSMPDDAEIYEC